MFFYVDFLYKFYPRKKPILIRKILHSNQIFTLNRLAQGRPEEQAYRANNRRPHPPDGAAARRRGQRGVLPRRSRPVHLHNGGDADPRPHSAAHPRRESGAVHPDQDRARHPGGRRVRPEGGVPLAGRAGGRLCRTHPPQVPGGVPEVRLHGHSQPQCGGEERGAVRARAVRRTSAGQYWRFL